MNPQDQTPRSNAEDAPPKVTPETPRSVIQVDLPTDDLDANCGDLPFLSLSTSFFAGIKRLEPRPGLSHDEDATRRTADLLRVLPVRKIALQRRERVFPTSPTPNASSALPCPLTPVRTNLISAEIITAVPCATPEQPRKRQRLSSPPALPHGVGREPMPFTPSNDVPANLLLPFF